MLGASLLSVLTATGARTVALDRGALDITDERGVAAALGDFAASLGHGERGVVLNAAAYTDVEGAEADPDSARAVNADAPRLLSRSAAGVGLAFVHVSTDFVFDGAKPGAYAESDEPQPLSVYGASKREGEVAVLEEHPEALIVRTCWLYGSGTRSFPDKILDVASRSPVLRVVTDEVGSPTYAPDLAEGLLRLEVAGARGIVQLAGSGSCSRYDFAVEALRLAGVEREVLPVTAEEFGGRARRPANSTFDCGLAASLGVVMPPWRSSLQAWSKARVAAGES
jgi:dTDP-4-dehydrorhamnose reductase